MPPLPRWAIPDPPPMPPAEETPEERRIYNARWRTVAGVKGARVPKVVWMPTGISMQIVALGSRTLPCGCLIIFSIEEQWVRIVLQGLKHL